MFNIAKNLVLNLSNNESAIIIFFTLVSKLMRMNYLRSLILYECHHDQAKPLPVKSQCSLLQGPPSHDTSPETSIEQILVAISFMMIFS